MNRRFFSVAGCLLLGLGCVADADVMVFDVADSFSPTMNPSGPWTYGYANALADPLIPYTVSSNAAGVDYWALGLGPTVPSIVHNPTAAPINYISNVTVQPDQVAMHPGASGEYAVLRFTAPVTAAYDLSTQFVDNLDPQGASVDVHVQHNGVSIFSDVVAGGMDAQFLAPALALTAGDTLDFRIGAMGNFLDDSTGIQAVITVPEPAAASVLITGGVLIARRRRLRSGG